MELAFWRDEWPGPRERERDPSIKAVLNKLGAFVSYGSIRSIVGQGDSTISPRMVMDAGDVLVVDLSGVGGDNAALFGAMLISRFAIDAVGRQGRLASERRPHLLVVDEAQRFHTQAMESILAEGRKFGLHIALAAQSCPRSATASPAPFARTWPRSRSWSPAPTTFATWAGCSPRSVPKSSWRCAGSTSSSGRAAPTARRWFAAGGSRCPGPPIPSACGSHRRKRRTGRSKVAGRS
jgi:hypothetical protein